MMTTNFVTGIKVDLPELSQYPYTIAAVMAMNDIKFASAVTFLAGENGSGKSTIIESLAIAAGFGPEGGTKNISFSTHDTTSDLHEHIRLIRGVRRERDGYFLRAESFYNVASYMESPSPNGPLRYGGISMHEQSHGESFLSLVNYRFNGDGLYLLDEPESALSPMRQLSLLVAMNQLVAKGSQFIIATHSPILLSYPGAEIYVLSADGVRKTKYQDVEHVRVTRDFMADPSRFHHSLFDDQIV